MPSRARQGAVTAANPDNVYAPHLTPAALMAARLQQFVAGQHDQQQPEKRAAQVREQDQRQVDHTRAPDGQVPECPFAGAVVLPRTCNQRKAPMVYCRVAYWL